MLERIVGKSPIVSVIVLDGDTMIGGIILEGYFGGHGLLGRVIDLEVHKVQTRVVVHKNGAAFVPLLDEFPVRCKPGCDTLLHL